MDKGKIILKNLQKTVGKMPIAVKPIKHIWKVTFETADGRSFAFFQPRVGKYKIAGNIAYQIWGPFPDLEDVLPESPDEQLEKKE